MKYKIAAKIQIFDFFSKTQHATDPLKLVDKMCKCEMDLAVIVEDTEWTRFRLQADGRTDKVKPVYPTQLRWQGYSESWGSLFT